MNTRSIFDTLCMHLKNRKDHTARVALGHACEQWISSEAFAVLNWNHSPNLDGSYFLCEKDDRDIIQLVDNNKIPHVIAVIEAKVVYPNKNLKVQIAKLREQTTRDAYPDEDDNTERGAILYAIWTDSHTRKDVKQIEAFYEVVLAEFKRQFSDAEFEFSPSEGMTSIIDKSEIDWSGVATPVAMRAISATLKKATR